ncbi:MAG TPA: hypothetical protein VKG38_08500 [Solirubrobacteraceae bacterium]|nr:hypothetical protein [Solirubrobacteraceae bacterium]
MQSPRSLGLCGDDRLVEQSGDRHRPDAAWDWCQQTGGTHGPIEVDVTDIAAVASVDHNSTRLQPAASHDAPASDCGHHDVTVADNAGQNRLCASGSR